jgi:3'(2'), 5'-bisphosphate nucleotidase
MTSSTAPADLLRELAVLARLAGAETLHVYSRPVAVSTKADASPVTEADLRADAVIRAGLARLCPGIPVVSEECLPAELPSADGCYLLVDPLDGTKEFLAGTGEFTVNIALVERGEAVAGVVYAPALDEMFYAARGVGAYRCDRAGEHAIRVQNYGGEASELRIMGSRSHGGERLARWVDSLAVNRVFAPAGSSLKFCRIAEGRAHLYPRLGPTSFWDTAAAQCVLEHAGGRVTDVAGSSLRYEPRQGWLNPEFIAWSDANCLALCAPLRDRCSDNC